MLKASKQFRSRLPQNGDTIVEVLICLAVVGFSLTLSYSLSRASLRKVRDAEERQQSTQMAQTQIERLKGFLAANPTIKTTFTIGSAWLLNPDSTVKRVPNSSTEATAPPGFCLYSGLRIHLTLDPQDPYCAASWTGEMYCDIISDKCNTTAPTEAAVNNAGYPFRVGIVYPAKKSMLSDSASFDQNFYTPLKDDELYATAGRLQVGGDGTNQLKYSAVGIPYRIHQ